MSEKRLAHLLFAIVSFSAGLSLLSTNILDDSNALASEIVGIVTVSACGVFWLLSRSLFRTDNAISSHHIAYVIVISLFFALYKTLLLLSETTFPDQESLTLFIKILKEVLIIFASSIVVLSFWEGLNGFRSSGEREKYLRLLYLGTFLLCTMIMKVSDVVFDDSMVKPDFIKSAIILTILINTQIVLYFRFHKAHPDDTLCDDSADAETDESVKADESVKEAESVKTGDSNADNLAELELAKDIEALIVNEKLYLTHHLTVGVLAKRLSLPEYKVSRIIKGLLNGANFNRYVNKYRIEHAKKLLVEPQNSEWSTLVVGLESGFSSIEPFRRAFKQETGLTPSQYKEEFLSSKGNST